MTIVLDSVCEAGMGISDPTFGYLTLAGMVCKSKEQKMRTQATMEMIH